MIDPTKLRIVLRDAFIFLDRMAGEGIGYADDGVILDADEICVGISDALGLEWKDDPFAFADNATASILEQKSAEIARLSVAVPGGDAP